MLRLQYKLCQKLDFDESARAARRAFFASNEEQEPQHTCYVKPQQFMPWSCHHHAIMMQTGEENAAGVRGNYVLSS